MITNDVLDPRELRSELRIVEGVLAKELGEDDDYIYFAAEQCEYAERRETLLAILGEHERRLRRELCVIEARINDDPEDCGAHEWRDELVDQLSDLLAD